jgi:hypothetical protein
VIYRRRLSGFGNVSQQGKAFDGSTLAMNLFAALEGNRRIESYEEPGEAHQSVGWE